MRRWPLVAFAALVLATVAAFFVTQHLKVTTPLIAGSPSPSPEAFNPVDGRTCAGVNHRGTAVSFYLLHRADQVAVYVVDSGGTIVRTLSSGRYMAIRQRGAGFYWNGREDDGTIAPDGTYFYRIALLQQGRTIELTGRPITVKSVAPRPVVTSVSTTSGPPPASGPLLVSEPGMPVRIHYRGNQQRSGMVVIYRTDLPGRPRFVKSFVTRWNSSSATWDGLVNHHPAPAGTYLIGFEVTDNACNTGTFPPAIPPASGVTPHAGVTVRYLAAQPPLVPVAAGALATVYVDARRHPYSWTLRRAGVAARRPLAAGAGRSYALSIRLPRGRSGLYELLIVSRSHVTEVPLIASAPAPARVLVVLPSLSWQGQNPVDDDGNGMPNTLTAGGPIALSRPLVNGRPAGFGQLAALLAYLDRAHLSYDLTTDLALIDGRGPGLGGHHGVVLAGSELWLPVGLLSALRAYASAGGHILAIGAGSLQRTVTISGSTALQPSAASAVDGLGARRGAVVDTKGQLVTAGQDALGIFSGTSGVFPAVHSFQAISPPNGSTQSGAGLGNGSDALAAFQIGRGLAVEIGQPDFPLSLARDVDAQELIGALWQVLRG
ncbi:MAG: FlgD immunoglobulin-like domain containing protein [Solirubrobacteraceae bacterium]